MRVALYCGAGTGDQAVFPLVILGLIGLTGAIAGLSAVVFGKWRTLRQANKKADDFEDRFWSGGSLDDLFDAEGTTPAHPMAAVFAAGMAEWRSSVQAAGLDVHRSWIHHRVDRILAMAIRWEVERLEREMAVLAAVRAMVPVIGWVGTGLGFAVVVAITGTWKPDLAGALGALTVGLLAAFLVVLAHDAVDADLVHFTGRLTSFGNELSAFLSHQSEINVAKPQ